jgi:hypothetical protein
VPPRVSFLHTTDIISFLGGFLPPHHTGDGGVEEGNPRRHTTGTGRWDGMEAGRSSAGGGLGAPLLQHRTQVRARTLTEGGELEWEGAQGAEGGPASEDGEDWRRAATWWERRGGGASGGPAASQVEERRRAGSDIRERRADSEKKIEAEAEAEEPVPMGGGRDAEDADARWARERKANGGTNARRSGKKGRPCFCLDFILFRSRDYIKTALGLQRRWTQMAQYPMILATYDHG